MHRAIGHQSYKNNCIGRHIATHPTMVKLSRAMVWAVLAQNRTFTAAQITGADDATVQTAVNAAVNLLAA